MCMVEPQNDPLINSLNHLLYIPRVVSDDGGSYKCSFESQFVIILIGWLILCIACYLSIVFRYV